MHSNVPNATESETVGNWRLTQLVLRNNYLKLPSEILTAVVLASYYDPVRGYSRVAISQLVKETRLAKRTIHTVIDNLEASGEWKIDRSQWSNRYTPNISILQARDKAEMGTIIEAPKPEPKEPKPAKEESDETESKASKKTNRRYDETTDPLKNGLPLISKSTDGTSPLVVQPPLLNDPELLATRLYRRYPKNTQKNSSGWTISKLRELYKDLKSNTNASYETIDILFWLQAEKSQAFNTTFLKTVLNFCSPTDENLIWAESPNTKKHNPALKVAQDVYTVHYQRSHIGQKENSKYGAAL